MSRKRLNLTGHKYGNLTVLEETRPVGKSRRWVCRCDCGNITIVYMTSLRSGNTKSCGCIKSENISKANVKDLTGMRTGRLTVKGRAPNKPNVATTFWYCKCDCGKDTVARASNLSSGRTVSCGCLWGSNQYKGKKEEENNEDK